MRSKSDRHCSRSAIDDTDCITMHLDADGRAIKLDKIFDCRDFVQQHSAYARLALEAHVASSLAVVFPALPLLVS